jgi:probable phosphoglycerate mutase
MIRLGLLRHGHTAWNRAGRLQGRTDIPLDDTARADLAALALPPGWQDADLVASPLARAMETAALVCGRAATPVPDLTEMNWGDWEGLHGIDLRADPASGYRDIETWGWNYRPPGGESPAEVRDRVFGWLATCNRDTVIVSHIGVMRVILAVASGWHFDGPAPFRIKRGRLHVVTFPAGAPNRMQADLVPVRLIGKDI